MDTSGTFHPPAPWRWHAGMSVQVREAIANRKPPFVWKLFRWMPVFSTGLCYTGTLLSGMVILYGPHLLFSRLARSPNASSVVHGIGVGGSFVVPALGILLVAALLVTAGLRLRDRVIDVDRLLMSLSLMGGLFLCLLSLLEVDFGHRGHRWCRHAPGTTTLEMISSLGRRSCPGDFKCVEALHARAHEAAPLLVAELKVVNPDGPDPDDGHVIWCIRALRCLTGKDFQRRTKVAGPYAMEEQYPRNEPMPFFWEWMSHGQLFLAPKDVQTAVIEDWRKWIAENPRFAVQPFTDLGDWYW